MFRPMVTPEDAAAWDHLADISEVDVIPGELTTLDGDFDIFVAPKGILPVGMFGGYDEIDDETGEIRTTLIVGSEVPKEARPALAAHILLHKIIPDNGAPYLCKDHDRLLQSRIADIDPGALGSFFHSSDEVYSRGYQAYSGMSGVDRLLVERYQKAMQNARRQGEGFDLSEAARQRLTELGLELPDGEVAINAVHKPTGIRTDISLQTERGTKHKCRSCSNPIVKGTARITTSAKQAHEGRDHHHFHPGCFTHIELGIFGDVHQIPHEEALWVPPNARAKKR